MAERILQGPIAYVTTQYKEYNTTDQAGKLEHLDRVGRRYIEQGHSPFYDSQFLEHHIAKLRREQRGSNFSFNWLPENPHGNFLRQNTLREGYVLPVLASIDNIEELIKREPDIQNIVFAVYSNGYSVFREIAAHLRKEHPQISIVAGAVGSLYEESQQLADHVLQGNQIGEMRTLLGENIRNPLHIATARSITSTTFDGITKKNKYGIMITSYGCPYTCDFCPTTAQYQGKYETPHTPDEIVNAIYQAHETVAPGKPVMSLNLADPQGLGDVPVWKEVFKRCKDMGFMVELSTTTSSKILRQFTPEELTGGDLCVTCVNVGVESMLVPYAKNRGVDLKNLIDKYQSAGIRIAVTFIIGHDWHTNENIWQDVDQIQQLGASGYIVSNMMMERGTSLFNKMKATGRLLDVPPEFESSYGYQAFTHPQFEPGFNAMVPILSEIERKLNQGTDMFNRDMHFYMKRANRRLIETQAGLKQQEDEIEKNAGSEEDIAIQKALLFYQTIFRNIDLFHPYITWNV
ncbi:radical SAM protein [Candidatus Roizmanbacteria bacterium]|nr:radical SAM protein [Candidatus Roizmanbacteria bacterium]